MSMGPSDVARIRFVTERFHDLQSLPHVLRSSICFGAALFGSDILLLPVVGPLGWPLLLGGIAVFVFGGPWLAHRVEESYTRFGRVSESSNRTRERLVVAAAVLFALAADVAWYYSGRPLLHVLPLSLAVVYGRIAVRDWPWRGHHAVPTLVFAAASAMPLQGLPAELIVCATFGLMLGAAVLDHMLLVRTLGRPPRTPDEAAAAVPD